MNGSTHRDRRPCSRSAETLLVLTAVLVVMPCAARAQNSIDPAMLGAYTERIPTGFLNWGQGYGEVQVEATFDTDRFGASHAKIKAIEEAEKKANDALYRLFRGINIDGDARLAGNTELEETLRLVIKKQRKMAGKKTANVTMKARFQLSMYGKNSLAARVHALIRPEVSQAGAVAGSSGGGHTSVIFDASGTSLQTALFPRVLNEAGEILFGADDFSEDAIKQGAAVTYLVRSEDSDKKTGKQMARLLGENPVVIKVGKISGDFLADIVLRTDEEQQLRAAQVGDLLAAGQIFVIQTASVDVTEQ